VTGPKIDYVAEANRIVGQFGVSQFPPDWQLAAFMAAQVNATLALVEQQRITNELAFLRFTLAEIQGGRASDIDDDALQALAKRVTDGLGL
jgi:hypothetical protein